eukprot:Seg2999.4 transcript_id=Seg2999.4/GoldUCD/mRNA.D3Y31 product="hypothetical protein" protein_id=Seg2999.4/GoldUCD/D3Y31
MDANSRNKETPECLSEETEENAAEINTKGQPPSLGLGPPHAINECPCPGNMDAEIFKSPEAIKAFHNLTKDLRINSNSGKYGKGQIKESTFEPNGMCNGFSTTTETLPLWIYALQETLFIEIGNKATYTVEWKNKTNKSGCIIEIELKTTKVSKASSSSPAHLYSVCVYLSTGLILIKGNELDRFSTDVFPKAKAIVHSLQNQKVPSNEPTSFSTADAPIHVQENVELANELKEIKAGCSTR